MELLMICVAALEPQLLRTRSRAGDVRASPVVAGLDAFAWGLAHFFKSVWNFLFSLPLSLSLLGGSCLPRGVLLLGENC